jgi:hypothetical protein
VSISELYNLLHLLSGAWVDDDVHILVELAIP